MPLVVIHQLASHSAICTEQVVCEMGYFSVIRLLCSCPILCPDIHPPAYGTAAECLSCCYVYLVSFTMIRLAITYETPFFGRIQCRLVDALSPLSLVPLLSSFGGVRALSPLKLGGDVDTMSPEPIRLPI